ncbi:hypothetical protein BGZ65_012373, partial [Modicella reniformis]
DIVIPPYPQSRYQCNEQCLGALTRLEETKITWQSPGAEITESVPDSDLKITIGFREQTRMEFAIFVSAYNGQGELHEALKIPPCRFGDEVAIYKFYVDKASLTLVIDAHRSIMVWKLPTTFKEDPVMLLTLWVQQPSVKDTGDGDKRKIFKHDAELKTCQHGRIYTTVEGESGHIKDVSLCINDTLAGDSLRFNAGVLSLIPMFGEGNGIFQQAVLKYVGRYINRTMYCNHQPETILTYVCKGLERQNYDHFDPFLKALFDLVHVRWVPRPGLTREMNPILLLLDVAKTIPRAINLAQIVIDYCIRLAKAESNFSFVSPVLDSLQEILKLKELPPDL